MSTSPPSPGRVVPARPHQALTQQGNRVREVLTYSRRGARLSDAQGATWERHASAWWVPDECVDQPGVDPRDWFERPAPLVIEIGCGIGEATVGLAAAHPELNLLGFEVWRPGVAETLGRIDAARVENLRMISVDAVWSLEHLVRPGSLAGLWTFFPDPWPKTRHRKRRLVTPAFAAVATERLAPGASWRLATDWPEYAEQMAEVLGAQPGLTGGVVERWEERPMTRFERRGRRDGRLIVDLCYQRDAAPDDTMRP